MMAPAVDVNKWRGHDDQRASSSIARGRRSPCAHAGCTERWESAHCVSKKLALLLLTAARTQTALLYQPTFPNLNRKAHQAGLSRFEPRASEPKMFFDKAQEALGVANKILKSDPVVGGLRTVGINIDTTADDAQDEATVMGPTSELPVLDAVDTAAKAVSEMSVWGVTRLNNVVPREDAIAAFNELGTKLEQYKQTVEKFGDREAFFGKVRKPSKKRYNVLLDPADKRIPASTKVVSVALAGELGDLLDGLGLGADAPVYEFAALLSDQGAQRQPLYPETPSDKCFITVLLALQDIEVDMGPILFLKGTSGQDAHDLFGAKGAVRTSFMQATPSAANILKAGDVAIVDSRIFRAGDENTSGRRAAYLYFSIARPGSNSNLPIESSISSRGRGKHTLESLKAGAA